MKELIDRYEEAVFRFNRLENKDPSERVEKGEEIYLGFKSYLHEKYPLYTLGDDKIVDVLRQYPADHYRYRISGNEVEFPAKNEKNSVLVHKEYISETLNAVSFYEKIAAILTSYKSDVTFQEIMEEVDKLEDTDSKIDFLVNLKFSKEIQSLAKPNKIDILIEEAISNLENVKEKPTESESFLVLGNRQKVNLIELMDMVLEVGMILDKRTNAPVTPQVLIAHCEKVLNTDLSEYYNIRKDAYLAVKRSVDGNTFLTNLVKRQKIKIMEINSKDG
jgi:hypothetical protein